MASREGGERRETAAGALHRAENYADSMLTSLAELQEQQPLNDFTLKIGDRTLTAHRCVLKVASEYFRALFDSGMTEVESGEVILDHLDLDGVTTAIDYMYGRSIEFDLHDLIPLIAVADYFKLDLLKERLCEHIVEELSTANCIYWYQVADQYAMEYLKKVAKEVIRLEFSDVAFSEEFKKLPVSSVADCIQHENPVPVDTILRAILTWIVADVDSRKAHFVRLADHIDFRPCSLDHLSFVQHQCQDHDMFQESSEYLSKFIAPGLLPVDYVPKRPSVLLCSGYIRTIQDLNSPTHKVNISTSEDGIQDGGKSSERREIRTLDRAENYADSVLTYLAELQEQKSLTDFTLKIGDRTLTAHRCVLKVGSEYFRALFNSGMTEAEAGEVILDHLDFDGVTTVIDYMYGRSIEFELHDLIPLISVANDLKLDKLKERVCEVIVECISPANCIYWYQVADLYAMEYLKKVSKEAIRIEFSDVAFSEEFMSLPVSSVVDCIEHEIPVPVDTALKACLTWIATDVDSRKGDFVRFAGHIDFSSCSQEHLMFVQNHCKDLDMTPECLEYFSEYITQDVLPVDHVPEKQSILLCSGHGDMYELNSYIYEVNLSTSNDYQVAQIPDECIRVMAAMCSTPQGIFSAGGKESVEYLGAPGSTVCWMYNKYTRRVQLLPPLSVPTYGAGAAFMKNKIYVIGGQENKTSEVDILDLSTTEWIAGPDLLHDVRNPKVTTIGYNIYILNDSDFQERQISIQSLDTHTNTWSLISLPPSVRNTSEVPMFSAANTLYCLSPTCIQYNITSGTWMDMTQPDDFARMFSSATPVRMGNKVVVCGGIGGGSLPTLTYHLDDDKWTMQRAPSVMGNLSMTFCVAL